MEPFPSVSQRRNSHSRLQLHTLQYLHQGVHAICSMSSHFSGSRYIHIYLMHTCNVDSNYSTYHFMIPWIPLQYTESSNQAKRQKSEPCIIKSKLDQIKYGSTFLSFWEWQGTTHLLFNTGCLKVVQGILRSFAPDKEVTPQSEWSWAMFRQVVWIPHGNSIYIKSADFRPPPGRFFLGPRGHL